MKKYKPIDFNNSNIFSSIFTTICLFILEVILVGIIELVIKFPIVSHIIGATIISLSIFYLERKRLIGMIKSFKKDLKDNYKKIIIVFIVFLLLEFIINYLILKFTGIKPGNDQIVIERMQDNNIFLFLLFILLISPTFEAILYFYPYNGIKNRKLACIVCSVIFALFHLTATSSLLELLYFIPYTLMSFAFTYGYFKTNNIYVSIIAHSINNLLAFMLLFIM